MKVPNELVEAALKAGWGDEGLIAKPGLRKALEAVLPKVRERLLAQVKGSDELIEVFEAAFDHAFPEEGS